MRCIERQHTGASGQWFGEGDELLAEPAFKFTPNLLISGRSKADTSSSSKVILVWHPLLIDYSTLPGGPLKDIDHKVNIILSMQSRNSRAYSGPV